MMRVISASWRAHSFAIAVSTSSFVPCGRYAIEWTVLSRVIRLGTTLVLVSRLQATTAGCSAGFVIEISTGVRSATTSTSWDCHGIACGIETAWASVLLGYPHGALQPSMFHFQPNVTMLQRAHPVGDEETGFEAAGVRQVPTEGSHCSKLQGGRNPCTLKSDPHVPHASRRPASKKAHGSPLEFSDMSQDFANCRPAADRFCAPCDAIPECFCPVRGQFQTFSHVHRRRPPARKFPIDRQHL